MVPGRKGQRQWDLWESGQLQKSCSPEGVATKNVLMSFPSMPWACSGSSDPLLWVPCACSWPLVLVLHLQQNESHPANTTVNWFFGGCGPFYSDYAVLQLRLLNFSPLWSLIFTNHDTITVFYIAQPESGPRGLLAAPGKIKGEINILEGETVLKGQTLSSYKSV